MKRLGVYRSRAVAAAAASVCILCAVSGAGQADPIINNNRYCSAGANPANTADTVLGGLLSVNDVTLTITGAAPQYTSSDCYGDFGIGSQDPTSETNALNTIFGDISGPDQLSYLDKFNYDNTPASNSAVGLGGITFVVQTSGGVGGAAGTWTIAWTDTNGAALQNLPLTVDLAVLLMGGNNMSAYLLASVLLPLSPTSASGTFDIQFLNNGGRQPTISHLTLAGRVVPTTNIIEVPEPATMMTFGAGLVGLWAFRRKRSA